MKTLIEQVDKRTKEYKFLLKRIEAISNTVNRQAVVNIGYSPYLTGLRVKDINVLHTFNLN